MTTSSPLPPSQPSPTAPTHRDEGAGSKSFPVGLGGPYGEELNHRPVSSQRTEATLVFRPGLCEWGPFIPLYPDPGFCRPGSALGSASTPQGPWPLGDHTPPPSSPRHLSPALPLFTLSQPPFKPTLEHFPEPPPALFFPSVSLGMGDRIFLGPSAPLSPGCSHVS